MRTDYLKIKLEAILYKLIKDADIETSFELTYCDKFTAKSCLDLIIKVDLSISTEGHDENQLTKIEFDSCQVDKFEVIDENSDPVCSGSQIKELVKYTNEFIKHFYSNL